MKRIFSKCCQLVAAGLVTALAVGSARAQQNGPVYVNPALFTSWEKTLLGAAGDRMQAHGKERLTMAGHFSRSGKDGGTVTITREADNKIRIDQSAQTGKPLVINGGTPESVGNLSDDDKDLLESFYADSADLFFRANSQGAGYRLLGGRFRADDGSTANYSGPWYLVYQLVVPLKFRGESGVRSKVFAFDASNGLLAAVRYRMTRGGSKVDVGVEYSGWQKVSGQAVPATIRRMENGVEIWRFGVTRATVGPLVADGMFSLP